MKKLIFSESSGYCRLLELRQDRTHHKLTLHLDITELFKPKLAIRSAGYCSLGRVYNCDHGHGCLHHCTFYFQSMYKSPTGTHGIKQTKLSLASTWPKNWGLSYQSFFEWLQSLSLCFSLNFLLFFALVFLKTHPHTKQGSAQPHHTAHPFLSRCRACNLLLFGVVVNSCILTSLGFGVGNT